MAQPSATTLPALHVRPVRGWLNDPNGIVRHRDRWHVFYQHNPLRAQHGDIAWAHVSSPDLVRWTEHPVAFSPTPGGPDRGGCWSGAFLPWLDVPAVAYTGVGAGPERSAVCVRTALDDGLDTWSGRSSSRRNRSTLVCWPCATPSRSSTAAGAGPCSAPG